MTQTINANFFRLKNYNCFNNPEVFILDNLNQYYLLKKNIFFFIKKYRKFSFFFFNFSIQRCYIDKLKVFFFGYAKRKWKFFKKTKKKDSIFNINNLNFNHFFVHLKLIKKSYINYFNYNFSIYNVFFFSKNKTYKNLIFRNSFFKIKFLLLYIKEYIKHKLYMNRYKISSLKNLIVSFKDNKISQIIISRNYVYKTLIDIKTLNKNIYFNFLISIWNFKQLIIVGVTNYILQNFFFNNYLNFKLFLYIIIFQINELNFFLHWYGFILSYLKSSILNIDKCLFLGFLVEKELKTTTLDYNFGTIFIVDDFYWRDNLGFKKIFLKYFNLNSFKKINYLLKRKIRKKKKKFIGIFFKFKKNQLPKNNFIKFYYDFISWIKVLKLKKKIKRKRYLKNKKVTKKYDKNKKIS